MENGNLFASGRFLKKTTEGHNSSAKFLDANLRKSGNLDVVFIFGPKCQILILQGNCLSLRGWNREIWEVPFSSVKVS